MGNTEWAILVRSDEDIRYWLQVTQQHNTWENVDEVGEHLDVFAVLNYVTDSKDAEPEVPTGKYLLMANMGGRSYTMDFLVRRKRPGDVILGLGDKPRNWLDCKEMAWQHPATIASGEIAAGLDVPDIPALFN